MNRYECTPDYYLGEAEHCEDVRKRYMVLGPHGIEFDGLTRCVAEKKVDTLNAKCPPECEFCGGIGCYRCDRTR